MRRALTGAAAAALLAAVPASAQAAGGFSLGVATGEVKPRSAKVWAHNEKPGKVELEVADNRRIKRPIVNGTFKAARGDDGTVSVTVNGLEPATDYWFRFCRRAGCSDKGRFTTAPPAKRSKKISFAFTGDADATRAPGESKPFFGGYKAFKAMRKEDNDFNVFIGDTIYSDSGVAGPDALTKKQKWEKYRLGLELKNLRKLRGSGPLYTHWDDHEFINDFSIPEDGTELYWAGVQAFTDYAPVTFSEKNGIYRTFRWGKNVELFFLDERSFRDAKADFGGACDNPATGSPDLAPTASPGRRAFFSALIPSLSNPVSQACKDAINDPGRTMLGRRQLNRFLDEVAASKARWKLVLNETPIQQFYGLPYDRWEGYAYERVMILQELQDRGVENLAFLTTDTHADFVNVVRERSFADDVAPSNAPAQPTDTPFSDYVAGPVATNTFWAEIDDVTGGEGSGELLSQFFFKADPPNGVGMLCAQGDQNSYAQVTATKKRLEVAYRTEAGERVLDVDGEPCGPYVLRR